MDLRQLQTFVEVVERGSFSGAADALGVTQPAVSQQVATLEKSAGTSRRSIANRVDRYRLVLLPEPGSVVSTFLRAIANAESVQDSLSPEAWATLSELRSRFQRTSYRDGLDEQEAVRITRRMADTTTQFIPQFFAIAGNTMLADDGWTIATKDGSLSAHWEHTVAVTDDGPRVLTLA